jgi:hypothetical protein
MLSDSRQNQLPRASRSVGNLLETRPAETRSGCLRRGFGDSHRAEDQTPASGIASHRHGRATEYAMTTASRLFDFRTKAGNLGECQLERSAIVMFAGGVVKPAWRIAATPTKFPSRTWPPSLRPWIDGRKGRPAEPSGPSHPSRDTSTASRNRRSGNRWVSCSPEPTDHRRRRWIVKGGKIGFSMANHLPRSPRLNRAIQPASLASGVFVRTMACDGYSVKRRAMAGRMGDLWEADSPLGHPLRLLSNTRETSRALPSHESPPNIDFLSQQINHHDHQERQKS